MTVKSFPRGGKKPEGVQHSGSANIFKRTIKKKEKRGHRKKNNETPKEETHFVATTAERLLNATLQEGLIILGRVHEVTEYDVFVSIPGGLVGRVQVTDISESYTNLLRSIINSEGDQPNEFKSLPELYSPGDYVVCCVKSLLSEGRWRIVLSLEPKVINQNVDFHYLVKGSKVVCTVTSVEDHGYVVDTGIVNVRAFVPKAEVDGEKCYYSGKQLLCNIKGSKTNENACTLTLSAKQKQVWLLSPGEISSLDALIPGSRHVLSVTKVLRNGLQVSFGNNCIGFINQIYLTDPLSAYVRGMEVPGTLLYIMPTVKYAYFSLLKDKPRTEILKTGEMIGKAITLYRESNGVVLKLTESGLRGFVTLRRTDIDFNDITEKITAGSKHKCRVLSYNWMEDVYVCTMQRDIMQQRYFSLADFKAGDLMKVEIKSINPESNFVNVQADKINGYVAPEHVSDIGLSALKKFKVGQQIQARVLGTDSERNRVRFTLKESLIKSDLPVLSNIHEATCGCQHHGTIVQINKNGLLVRFFEDLKGWVPCISLDKRTADRNWNYSIGQTVLAKIESVDEAAGKMKLSLPTKIEKQVNEIKAEEAEFVLGEEVEGTITESSIEGVYLKISQNNGRNVSTGFLPAGHMSPCPDVAARLASKCVPGDTLSALVFATAPSLLLTRTFLPQEQYRDFKKLKVGDCIPCSIQDITSDGLRVLVPVTNCTPFAFIKYANVSNFNALHTNQMLFVKIVSINKKEKQLGLTMILKKVYEVPDPLNKMMAAVDSLTIYLNKLSELSQNSYYKNRPISTVFLGQRVKGDIQKITENGLVVKLQNNLTGTVSKDHYTKTYKVGDQVRGTVLWKNYIHELVELTLIPSMMKRISTQQDKTKRLPTETVLRAQILMVTQWFVLIVVKGKNKHCLAALPARLHVNDLQPDLSPYVVGARLRCYAIFNKDQCDIMPICMLKSAFEMSKLRPDTKVEVNESKNLKRKHAAPATEEVSVPPKISKLKEDPETTEADATTKKTKKTNVPEPVDKKGLPEKIKDEPAEKKKKKKKKLKEEKKQQEEPVEMECIEEKEEDVDIKTRIPECGFYWDDKPNPDLKLDAESSADSEDEVEQSKQKKKKLTAAERREQERQKEREIREREEALASNQLPSSVDQFDRLVLASPDSSLIWLQYMAYHLQATEIEKARAVARRAIKTISFREENERLNVWNAWLNLESKLGTPESLNDVFQEAVRTNDAFKVYTHMLSVHVEAGRQNELEKLINTMIGKFKQDPQTWIECGTAFIKMGLTDKSRHIMQRALQSLPAAHHVNLMVRFANLENKFGNKERSQTLFEQILSSYPKRVDIWSSYVDALIKSGDIEVARKVLDRAIVQSLPARKMKSLFKKYVSFEEQHGTQEGVERVQQLAFEYVEKQCNNESL